MAEIEYNGMVLKGFDLSDPDKYRGAHIPVHKGQGGPIVGAITLGDYDSSGVYQARMYVVSGEIPYSHDQLWTDAENEMVLLPAEDWARINE